MDTFLNRFANIIKGTIQGFDRIVFKGILRPIVHSKGMQNLLESQNVLNKNYKTWVKEKSDRIIQDADNYLYKQIGDSTIYIPSCNTRKEELAHKRQTELGITKGLIGVWSCVEACSTFKSTYDETVGYPQLKNNKSRCKYLYFYFDHADYGFMSIRLQTWAPYNIQIAMNGREWLRRSLDKEKCNYILSGNKFLHIDDYNLAQTLLDKQLDTKWNNMLNSFLPHVFPSMNEIFGDNMSYYWTVWQSERAKDYIFESHEALKPLIDDLLYHSLITGTSDRVLKYLGQTHPKSNPELFTRTKLWYDGFRVRHWINQNSIKLYNEKNILRFEMTMNKPENYKVYRHKEGYSEGDLKKVLPLRKGIADINLRVKVSDSKITNFTEHMATLSDRTSVEDLISSVIQPITEKGQRVRHLDIMGKDKLLLQSIADPIFDVDFITNKALQKKLLSSPWAKGMSCKKLSAKISRNLRLLRHHGIIKKLPSQRKYILTEKGQKLTSVLNATLAASTNVLLKSAS